MQKTVFFVLVLVFLIACQSQYRIANTNYDYKVVQIEENNTKTVTKKLNQISDSDVVDGNFIYEDENGGYIITDIQKEQDRQIVEAYPSELEFEYVTKFDKTYNRDASFVVYNKKLLSHHPDFKDLSPDFFMDDYYLNGACASMLESFERLKKCNFGLGCHIEADLYFERWCMKYMALATNDETWCDKIRLSLDDQCYWFMAEKKDDENLCLKINKGDLSIMKCLKDLAVQKGNPKICNNIQMWYEEALIRADKNPNLSKEMTNNVSVECIEESKKAIDEFPFRVIKYKQESDYFDKALKRIEGTIMEKLIFGNSTLEQCEFLLNSFNNLPGRSWGPADFANPDQLTLLCLMQLENCSYPSPIGDYCSFRTRSLSDCNNRDDNLRCIYLVALNSFGKGYDESFGDKTTDSLSLHKRMYLLPWIAMNADIETCLKISKNREHCLLPISSLWFDCDVCNFLNDENEKNQCKRAISIYSNEKVVCT